MPPIKFGLNRTYGLGRCRLKNYKIAAVAAILDTGVKRFLAILGLCVTVMPPIIFRLNPNYGLGGDVV